MQRFSNESAITPSDSFNNAAVGAANMYQLQTPQFNGRSPFITTTHISSQEQIKNVVAAGNDIRNQPIQRIKGGPVAAKGRDPAFSFIPLQQPTTTRLVNRLDIRSEDTRQLFMHLGNDYNNGL